MKTKTCIFAILLAAGLTNSRAQDTWTQKADFGGVIRAGATGLSIGNKGYIGLGDEYPISYKDFWEYDPDANTWTQKANFGGHARLYAVGFTIAGKAYVGTGQSGTFPNYTYYKDFWEYDPNSNIWTRKSDFGGTARYGAVGFSIDGKGYLGTGVDASITYKKDFWEFDPIQNTWTQKADFGGIERKWAIGLSIGAKGYVGTGLDSNGVIYKDFWEYDAAANTWSQKADFGGSARLVPAGFSIGNKGYIGTGEADLAGTSYSDFWEFDPTGNTWSQKSDFGGGPRNQAAGFSIGSNGYIGTGAVGSSTVYKDFWEYTPATAQTNPVPLINQPLVPDAIAPGGAGFTLTMNGTGFVTGSVVNWNGSAKATTFVSASQLTTTILAPDIATASTASLTVVNPALGGGTSNVVFFAITFATSSVSLTRSDYTVPSNPSWMVTADFNGDRRQDLASANGPSNTVSILIGNGDGTFQSHIDYATDATPGVLRTGDFNGDGTVDLVTSNNFSTVSVLLGNGDGSFGTHIDSPAGSNPAGMVTGDFNGDGKLDLAVTEPFGGNTVAILLGNGDGSFQAPVQYATGLTPGVLTTGDFNGDGKLDLAVPDEDCCAFSVKKVSVLLGNGDGTFQPHVDYTTGRGSIGAKTADFNGDGKLDLAVNNLADNTVSILLGNGDGTFQPHVDYATAVQGNGGSLITDDFNGDGQLDLVTNNLDSGTISLLLGNGNGTFQPHVDYGTGPNPRGSTAGDFNADGRLELAVPNNGSNTVSVFLQATTVALSDTSLRFGLQLVGTASTPQTATLTNTGAIALNISSITASGDFLQENNCGSSLPAGASCTIRVAFNPSAKGGQTGRVTITDNAADSPQTIKLKGTGTVVQVLPSALDFGHQIVGTTSDPQTATVTNIGSEDLHISGIALGGANFGDFAETTTCGSRLAAGGSCSIDVTFTPGARGHRNASLKIVDDGGGSPQAVPLAGTGVRR